MRTAFPWVLTLVAAMALCTTTASAHDLESTTARISLRDEHAQVHLRLDMVQLLAATSPGRPTRAELASLSDQQLTTLLDAARSMLENESRLTVDGVAIPLKLHGFPTASHVRATALRHDESANAHGHHEMTALRFDTVGNQQDGGAIGFRTATALGRVVQTFVQPSTHMVSPGEAAAFPILYRPAENLPAHANPVQPVTTANDASGPFNTKTRGALAVAAVALALAALVLQRKSLSTKRAV